MKTKNEMKKAKAVEYLKMMGICQDYIDIFQEKGVVTYYDRYIGFWAFQDEELMAKIKAIEEKWNVLVFAVTHEFNDDCEMYSFLYIPDEKDEWDDMVLFYNKPDTYYAFAYVWVKNRDYDSEFGSILVHSKFGGLRRIA